MSRPHILIIDDAAPMRMIAKRHLENYELDIAEAESAEEALSMLDEGKSFDLILADLEMPGVDGFEFLKKCDSHPVAIIASLHHENREKEARDLGAVDYIEKPYNAQKLAEQIGKALPGGKLEKKAD